MPGQNKNFLNFAVNYGLPVDIVNHGAATMYPEYRLTLGDLARSTARPEGGWDDEG